jgi:hypothetical protein
MMEGSSLRVGCSMSQNVYDQSCRYLLGLDPVGFFRWLLGLPVQAFTFRGLLDTRAISFPGEPDRTSDMVAYLTNLVEHGRPWALLLEFQIVPDSEMFGRVLTHLGAIWRYVRPDTERGSRFCVSAAIINLTGRGKCSQEMHWAEAELTTKLDVRERNLEYESADELLKGMESGQWPRSLLPLIPLMIGGDEPVIIDRWMALAEAELDTHRRGDYAAITLIFADRVGRKALWEDKIKGWNVTESAYLNEFIAKGRAEGEAKGRAEGRAEEARSLVLRLAAKRFGPAPSAVEAAIHAISDRERLARISERILDAGGWNDLLATS